MFAIGFWTRLSSCPLEVFRWHLPHVGHCFAILCLHVSGVFTNNSPLAAPNMGMGPVSITQPIIPSTQPKLTNRHLTINHQTQPIDEHTPLKTTTLSQWKTTAKYSSEKKVKTRKWAYSFLSLLPGFKKHRPWLQLIIMSSIILQYCKFELAVGLLWLPGNLVTCSFILFHSNQRTIMTKSVHWKNIFDNYVVTDCNGASDPRHLTQK